MTIRLIDENGTGCEYDRQEIYLIIAHKMCEDKRYVIDELICGVYRPLVDMSDKELIQFAELWCNLKEESLFTKGENHDKTS